jgi:predicted GNAT family acetyltransferase
LIYRAEPGRLILVHTEVPDALGGHGVGGRLVEAALDRARTTGETVVPWCPFARGWMRKHPDRLADLSVDWTTPPPSGS